MHSLPTFANAIQLVLTLGVLVSLWFFLMCFYGAREFFRTARRPNGHAGDDATLPGITVLKPLKGLEADLYDNLSTFCRQDYPSFQIVFGVADADDPAVPVVRRLQAYFPAARIDLVVDGRVYGSNYKISNLHNMYRAAAHDVIVIADSDIRVAPDYLRRIVRPLEDPAVGIVTCLYKAVSTGGLPTLVESLFVNTDFAPSVLVANIVETRRYAFGATITLRRCVLDEIGGFLPLANYLADDYYLGNRVAACGYRVALSEVVVETVLAVGSWKRLLDHQLRWARTYRSSRPGSYFALVLTHGTLWAVLNVLYSRGSAGAWLVATLMYAVRTGTAGIVANRYLHAPLSLRDTLLVPLKDLFVSAVWALAFLGDTVRWSGNEFHVLKDGQMVPSAADGAALPELPSYPAPNERDRRPASI